MDRDNRVIVRLGARELTAEEVEFVNGAGVAHTNVCTVVSTTTGPGDGDGCSDHDIA
jgi:hypothetical protein